MPKELVTGADFKILGGSGAPDKAKGSRGKALKVPKLSGKPKAAPKMRTTTTTMKGMKKKKNFTQKLAGY